MRIWNYINNRYLRRHMSGREKGNLEKGMGPNPELFRDLKKLEIPGTWISDREAVDFSQKLHLERKRVSTEETKTEVKKRSLFFSRWYVAAVIFILAAGAGWLVFQNRRLPAEKIFAKYYNPKNIPAFFYSTNNKESRSYQLGLYYLSKGDYPLAKKLFERMILTNPDRSELHLLVGISAMRNSEYDNAQYAFKEAIKLESGLMREEAEWGLGFSYLLSGEREEAYEIFNMIEEENGSYSKDAGKVVRYL